MICMVGSGSGGRNSSRPASYMVRCLDTGMKWPDYIIAFPDLFSFGSVGLSFALYLSIVVVGPFLFLRFSHCCPDRKGCYHCAGSFEGSE